MHITLGEALRNVKNFLLGKSDENSESTEHTTDFICKKCGEPLGLYEQFTNDIATIIVYQCANCGSFKELQYNEHNELMKDISIYDPFPSTNSHYLEILNTLKFNQFSLLRIWIINGIICFPVLMRSDISDNVTMLFVKVGTDLTHDNMHCFIVNDSNIISEAIISNDNSFSYFFNPYLSRLPYPDLNIKANQTERSDGIDYASSIRYQHKIQNIQNRTVHKLRIVKDYPMQNYGIEVYVKFITHETLEEDVLISEIIEKIDLESIILARHSVNIDINYSIQSSHVMKISYSTINKKCISSEQREKLCEHIIHFFNSI